MDRSQRPDPQEILAKLDQMQRDAEATLRKYDELRQDLVGSGVEAVSADGYVKVKLDQDGNVTEIAIDDAALRNRSQLSTTVLDTIKEATATHALKMADMAQSLVGDRVDVMGVMSRFMPDDMRDRARDNLNRRD
jgi:DNA-binding protein YbaB